jgi:hypothetical protein
MTQEVQVILTMEVDCSQSKEDIKNFIIEMEQTYTRTASTINRMLYPKIEIKQIKEEAEIYGNE